MNPNQPLNVLKKLGSIYWQSIQKWQKDYVATFAAALAYQAIFAIGPIILILVFVFSIFVGSQNAKDQVLTYVGSSIGSGIIPIVEKGIDNLNSGNGKLLTIFIAIIGLVLSSSSFIEQLRISLCTIWQTKPKELKPLEVIPDKLISVALILVGGAMFIISLFLSNIVYLASDYFQVQPFPILTGLGGLIISIISIALTLALAYKTLINKKTSWSELFFGSFTSAILLILVNYLLSFYFSAFAATSVFGAATSLVVSILWIYYVAQIILFGAEAAFIYKYRNQDYNLQNSITDEQNSLNGHQNNISNTQQDKPKKPASTIGILLTFVLLIFRKKKK